MRYSACLGCYCDVRQPREARPRRPVAFSSVGGNPYHPEQLHTRACTFETPLEEAYRSMSYANGYGQPHARHRSAAAARAPGTCTASPTASPCRSSAPASAARASGSQSAGTSSSRRSPRAASCSPSSGEDQRGRGLQAPSTTPRRPSNPERSRPGPRVEPDASCWAAAPTAAPLIGSRFADRFGTINNVRPRLHLRRLPSQRVRWQQTKLEQRLNFRCRGVRVRPLDGRIPRSDRQQLPGNRQAYRSTRLENRQVQDRRAGPGCWATAT